MSELEKQSQTTIDAPADILQHLASLYQVARKQISELEKQPGNEDLDDAMAQSPTDREKNVRSLRSLVRTIQDIVDLEQRCRQLTDGENKEEFDDQQRQDLARRIAVLRCRNRKRP